MSTVIYRTRAEAFHAGAKTFAPGTPCKNGHHNVVRYTSNGGCIACANRYATDRGLLVSGLREVVVRLTVPAYIFYGNDDIIAAAAQAAIDELAVEECARSTLAIKPPIG